MAGLAHVFLRNLQLDGFLSLRQRAEERRRRLANLEIDGAVLDLHDGVALELAVQLVEVVIRRAGAVVLEIAPVRMVVVDEAAVEQQAGMRLESARDHVGGVGVRAVIRGGADAAFGIGLEHDASEIRDRGVNFVGFGGPPGGDFGVDGVERIESADGLRAAEIDADGDADAPGTEGGGDARDLRNEIRREHARVGVDVVDGASIDTQRGEHPPVAADSAEIFARVQPIPEEGAAAITALDGAIEVVPLIHPTDGHRRRLLLIQIDDGFAESDFA